MGWFTDAMRLRNVIHVVTSIEIPLSAQAEAGDREDTLDEPRTGAARWRPDR